MGFMDNLKGQLTSAVGGALGGALGQQGGLVGGVMNLINNHPGGLAGLVQSFEQQGLGAVARSWVSTGPNQPITAAQIQQVLGTEKLQAFATQHGLDLTQVSAQLAQILPTVVDKLTPQGSIPPAASAPQGG